MLEAKQQQWTHFCPLFPFRLSRLFCVQAATSTSRRALVSCPLLLLAAVCVDFFVTISCDCRSELPASCPQEWPHGVVRISSRPHCRCATRLLSALHLRHVNLCADASIRDGKGLSYTDLVDGRGLVSAPAPQIIQPQPVNVATPEPIVGRAKKVGMRGGSEAEDEDDEGEGSALDQRRRRQQRRHRKEPGAGTPASVPAPAVAAVKSSSIDDAAGVGGVATSLPEEMRNFDKNQAAAFSSPVNALPSPVVPDLESMLQVARESLAAAAASGDDDDELDSDDDNVILLFHQQFLFV